MKAYKAQWCPLRIKERSLWRKISKTPGRRRRPRVEVKRRHSKANILTPALPLQALECLQDLAGSGGLHGCQLEGNFRIIVWLHDHFLHTPRILSTPLSISINTRICPRRNYPPIGICLVLAMQGKKTPRRKSGKRITRAGILNLT